MTRTCRQVPAQPSAYWAQDGWYYDESGKTRKPRLIEVQPFSDDYGCKYDRKHTDSECAGCARKGEK